MSYNPYNQGPGAEAGYGQSEQHEMHSYGQQPYGTPQQSYGSPQQQYGSPQQQYGSPQQQYGSPYAEDQYGSPQQEQYGALSPQQGSGNFLSQNDFLLRVSAIRQDIQGLTTSINNIATLHQQALASGDDKARQQLDDLVAATQVKNTSIRSQIQQLKSDTERTTDSTFGLKKRQFESLNSDFKDTIQKYLEEEQQYKQRFREQIARQYRIVNPEATEEQVQQAADADWGDEGIFQTALRTNRSGHGATVLGNVRARHNDMIKIEKSILQLLELLEILSQQIIQQDPIIADVAAKAEDTTKQLDNANVQIKKSTTSALRARKLKWWCLGICVLIAIVIALGVGLGVAFAGKGAETTNGQ